MTDSSVIRLYDQSIGNFVNVPCNLTRRILPRPTTTTTTATNCNTTTTTETTTTKQTISATVAPSNTTQQQFLKYLLTESRAAFQEKVNSSINEQVVSEEVEVEENMLQIDDGAMQELIDLTNTNDDDNVEYELRAMFNADESLVKIEGSTNCEEVYHFFFNLQSLEFMSKMYY